MCHTKSDAWHLTILAGLVSLAVAMTAAFYPGSQPLAEATPHWTLSAFAMILAQSIALVLPGLWLGLIVLRWSRKTAHTIASIWFMGITTIVLGDCVTFHWIAQRFLSHKTLAIAKALPQGLAAHVPTSTWWFAAKLVTGLCVFAFASWWIAKRLSRRIAGHTSVPSLRIVLFIAVLCTIAMATPAVWNLRTTRETMFHHSGRFPLCAFHLINTADSGTTATNVTNDAPAIIASMDSVVQNLQRRRESVSVKIDNDAELPDVVLVIIESMRSELVDPKTMPHLWKYSQKGIHCRQHFSTGNATNHGMFGVFSGLDATLYSRFCRQKPLLNRLFQNAGYEVGFFAGHDDWQAFRMNGFISSDHFDRFQVDKPNWLESDHRSTQRAQAFLGESRQHRPPRLAVLYLYSTHADYHSYPQDQIFQPAADDRFLIPYSLSEKPAVWNRYKNSAHCVDRFLSAVLRDDRVIIVTGDHGESFLEDGVCGHGTRISKFQNMTPAVIYSPGGEPKVIDAPTSHADLLPTLISAASITIDDQSIFAGNDLTNITPANLAQRVIVTRDYLSNQIALVNQELGSEQKVFAIRAALEPKSGSASIVGGIDERGNSTKTDGSASESASETFLKIWQRARFGW
ncbi:MAG: sulfatase-like hydrolase/transferase [Pirellulaceae bacterium]